MVPRRANGDPIPPTELPVELCPQDPKTDLKARPLRIWIDKETFGADGWGGARDTVQYSEVERVLAYDVERVNPRGPNPRWGGVLLYNADDEVVLRVTGRWNTSDVWKLFYRNWRLRCETVVGMERSDLGEIRRANRRKYRAKNWRKLRMRSRWLVLWHTIVIAVGLLSMIVAPITLGERYGDAVGVVGFVLVIVLWFLVEIMLPEWIRGFYAWKRTRRKEIRDERR